jgi:hypothetical protein
MNTTPAPDDTALVEHLRRTLHAVARTVADDGQASTLASAIPFVERSRRKPAKKNIAIAAAMAVAGLGLVAWNTFDDGEIEHIPTEAALMQGSTDGFDWWLVPSEAIGHTNPCDVPFPGVEMVSSSTNKPGQEWNTGGVNYGKNILDNQAPEGGGTFTYDCSNPQSEFDKAAWLDDPTLMSVGFTRLGRNDDPDSPWGAFAAMHPTIDLINVIVDGETIDTIDTITKPNDPGGVRYAGFTIPSDVCTFRLDYLQADAQTPVVSKESTIC